MAKRKRLSGPLPPVSVPDDLETKSLSDAPLGVIPKRRAPIADVAAEAATTSALQQMADTMDSARREGRMVVTLPLPAIDAHHLLRDRVTLDAAEMEVLKTSLAARGQQTPIEVVELGAGKYGLISGFRRLTALRELAGAGLGGDDILALIRQPEDAGAAYTAMVEENEIRVGLSYFERASIALRSVDKGVFPHDKAAIAGLFASASRSKRSKIKSFLPLVRHLGGHLVFPNALGERLGLALAAKLADDPDFVKATVKALKASRCETAEAEATLLQAALTPAKPTAKRDAPQAAPAVKQGRGQLLEIAGGAGQVTLMGDALTDPVIEEMWAWFAKRGIYLRSVE